MSYTQGNEFEVQQKIQRIGQGHRELPSLPSNGNNFWREAKVITEEVRPFKECEHYFENNPIGAECKFCHLGLPGLLAQEGKLQKRSGPRLD